jgi:hypothetical protein
LPWSGQLASQGPDQAGTSKDIEYSKEYVYWLSQRAQTSGILSFCTYMPSSA